MMTMWACAQCGMRVQDEDEASAHLGEHRQVEDAAASSTGIWPSRLTLRFERVEDA